MSNARLERQEAIALLQAFDRLPLPEWKAEVAAFFARCEAEWTTTVNRRAAFAMLTEMARQQGKLLWAEPDAIVCARPVDGADAVPVVLDALQQVKSGGEEDFGACAIVNGPPDVGVIIYAVDEARFG